jgi:hypothetical protein
MTGGKALPRSVYIIRDIEPALWQQVKERANGEGHPIRWVILQLLTNYVKTGLQPDHRGGATDELVDASGGPVRRQHRADAAGPVDADPLRGTGTPWKQLVSEAVRQSMRERIILDRDDTAAEAWTRELLADPIFRQQMRRLLQRAFDRALGELSEDVPEDFPRAARHPAAVALGRKGGRKSGERSMKLVSPEQRQHIARVAALARWAKARWAKEGG